VHALSITLSEAENRCAIRFEDNVDIASATELKQTLLRALAPGKELEADLSAAGGLDITAIQLLWAAAREAEKSGTAFTLAGDLPEGIRGALRDAGFDPHLNPSTPKSETTDSTVVSTEMADDGHR
jgi:anti-anti-sigma regulatory factor